MNGKNLALLGLAAFFLPLLSMVGIGHAGQTVAITYDADNAMHAFGVRDLQQALEATGNQVVGENAAFRIAITHFEPGMGPQSFRIQREGTRGVRIVAGDSVGAMYGAMELAEQIGLGGGRDAVHDIARKPYILRRGLKFNIPLDARAPSYDDTGTSAMRTSP